MTLPLAALAPAALGTVARVAGGIADAINSGNAADRSRSASGSSARSLTERLQALDAKTAEKITRTSTDFESMFLENMLNQVFASTGEEGPLGNNGVGGDAYKSMLVNEYARMMTKSGGVGIAESVMAEMIKLQEGA